MENTAQFCMAVIRFLSDLIHSIGWAKWVDVLLVIAALASARYALKAATTAAQMYELAVRHYTQDITPQVTAIVEEPPVHGPRRGVVLVNWGKGPALHVTTDLKGSRNDAVGEPHEENVRDDTVRDLLPVDSVLLSLSTDSACWVSVWGTIEYEDLDGNRYRTQQGTPADRWRHTLL